MQIENVNTFTSRNGLSVTIPQPIFDQMLGSLGTLSGVRERVLNDAGRALKHRRELADFYAQELTAEQRQQVAQVASAMIRQDAIYSAACEMGYQPYVDRAIAGRPTNDAQWARIIERAREHAGQIDDTPTAEDLNSAMSELGMLTGNDAEYSRRLTLPTWSISAPDGWNGQSSNHREATN